GTIEEIAPCFKEEVESKCLEFNSNRLDLKSIKDRMRWHGSRLPIFQRHEWWRTWRQNCKGFKPGELSRDQDSLRIHVHDPEDHSVSEWIRVQKIRSTDRLVRSTDVPSRSIQTRHQDPE
ncbi:hypothetical protein ACLOJK_034381, partial [Asimina triloba]